MFLIELRCYTVGEPELVRGIVECSGRPDRPVHEVLAAILGVAVPVKDIDDRKLAGLQRQTGYIGLAGELHGSTGQVFLFTAEPESLAHKQARGVVVRVGKV